MAEIHDLDPTDASNTGRFPENQAPSTVNDGARALEGLIARWESDQDYSVTATVSGSVIQMTANRTSLTLTGTTSNYFSGLHMAFTMGDNPITGPASINIGGIGPISLRDSQGSSLSSSILLSGMRVRITKDGTNDYFRLLEPGQRFNSFSGLTADNGELSVDAASATVSGVVEKATQAEMEAETADKYPDASLVKYSPGVAKAWALVTVSGGTPSVTTSYNVDSVTDNGTGDYTINWATNFSSGDYAVIAVPLDTTLARGVQIHSTAAGAAQVLLYNASGTAIDASFMIAAFGDQ